MEMGCNANMINKERRQNKNDRPYCIGSSETYEGRAIISCKVLHGHDKDSSNGEGIASDILVPKIHVNCHQMIAPNK